mmetsp:Transcript_7779/g.18043  ORF Transcript_7779/g.18043 Transcript_7779/m.18043 type:complete len:494 (+) Transcript_7779:59-1540(+)
MAERGALVDRSNAKGVDDDREHLPLRLVLGRAHAKHTLSANPEGEDLVVEVHLDRSVGLHKVTLRARELCARVLLHPEVVGSRLQLADGEGLWSKALGLVHVQGSCLCARVSGVALEGVVDHARLAVVHAGRLQVRVQVLRFRAPTENDASLVRMQLRGQVSVDLQAFLRQLEVLSVVGKVVVGHPEHVVANGQHVVEAAACRGHRGLSQHAVLQELDVGSTVQHVAGGAVGHDELDIGLGRGRGVRLGQHRRRTLRPGEAGVALGPFCSLRSRRPRQARRAGQTHGAVTSLVTLGPNLASSSSDPSRTGQAGRTIDTRHSGRASDTRQALGPHGAGGAGRTRDALRPRHANGATRTLLARSANSSLHTRGTDGARETSAARLALLAHVTLGPRGACDTLGALGSGRALVASLAHGPVHALGSRQAGRTLRASLALVALSPRRSWQTRQADGTRLLGKFGHLRASSLDLCNDRRERLSSRRLVSCRRRRHVGR